MIVLGLSTNSASHPCPFCEIKITRATDKSLHVSSGVLRTCAYIRKNCASLLEGGDISNHKDHKSCIHNPLELFPLNDKIINYVQLPELHMHYLNIQKSGEWSAHFLCIYFIYLSRWCLRYFFVP